MYWVINKPQQVKIKNTGITQTTHQTLMQLIKLEIRESTYSLRDVSTSFLEGKVHPSNTRTGLIPLDSNIFTNFIQNPTYL